MIAGDRHHRRERRAGRHRRTGRARPGRRASARRPRRARGAGSLAGFAAGAARRDEREGEAEDAARRPSRSAVRHATRAPAERPPVTSGRSPSDLAAQVLDDGDPGRVELVRGRRAASSGDAVRLLDERDARRPRSSAASDAGDEVAGRHAAAGAVAEHEPGRGSRRSLGCRCTRPGRAACRRRASSTECADR